MALTPEDLPALIDPLKQNLESADAAAVPSLSQLGGIARRRARRMELVAQRLEARSGPGDPRVVRLMSRLEAQRSMAAHHASAAARIAKLPKRGPQDCAILGRVLDHRRNPVRAVRVRLTDAKRKVDIPGRTATTDDSGDFVLVFPKCELGEAGDKQPTVVAVETSRRKLLYLSEPVKTAAGRALYLLIVLPEQEAVS